MLVGNITLCAWETRADAEMFLRCIGVELVAFIPSRGWEVKLDLDALAKLDQHWGRFVWSLSEAP